MEGVCRNCRYCVSRVPCYMSRVTCPVLHVTCHMSRVTCPGHVPAPVGRPRVPAGAPPQPQDAAAGQSPQGERGALMRCVIILYFVFIGNSKHGHQLVISCSCTAGSGRPRRGLRARTWGWVPSCTALYCVLYCTGH